LPIPVSITLSKNDGIKKTVPAEAYDDFPYFLKFEGVDELKYKDKPVVAGFTTAKGLFGYDVLLHKELR
jgi:hypothetical protein